MKNRIEDEINGIVGTILDDYKNGREIDKREDLFNKLDKNAIIKIVHKLVKIVYPGYFRDKAYKFYDSDNHLSVLIEDAVFSLNKQIMLVLKYSEDYKDAADIEQESQKITIAFFKKIPAIRAYCETDLQATYDGDPAAYNKDEIIFSYPGLFAITVNRIAHELFLLSVPLIPRIMTEYAHSVTGIDIHPGATIGKYFFIDHGTGIVVGETTVIGDHVKVYQGVTLGALSTKGGQRLKNTKRHPTIEDHVTIYSGASIFGGETVIGENAVIGSNAFITRSVKADTTVSIKNQELQFRSGGKKLVETSDFQQDDIWYYNI